jgi:hypothetical protein
MRIKVDGVGPVTKEAKYFHFLLNYSQDGKPQKPRKIVSFGASEVGYKALKDATVGQSFDVTLAKDDNGYWQWKDVVPVAAGAPEVATAGSTGKSGNWETSEERSRRQVLIVRQSCLAQAVQAIGPDQNYDKYTEMAALFENWVNRTNDDEPVMEVD